MWTKEQIIAGLKRIMSESLEAEILYSDIIRNRHVVSEDETLDRAEGLIESHDFWDSCSD